MWKNILILFAAGLTACQGSKKGNSQGVDPNAPVPVVAQEGDQLVLAYKNLGDVELVDIATVMGSNEKRQNLIGGKPQDPKDWPASFTSMQGNSRCTGTLLGPQTLQIAAHCVGNGRTARLRSQGVEYSGVCRHSPKYASDPTADYALCYMDKPVDVEWYEGLMLDEKYPKVGMQLTLAGMGCTQPGGGGGNDNTFRAGTAPITRLPVRDNDIVTVGNSALCFGDSGGSAFITDEKGVLKVVGVNSRGDIRKTSYLSAVYTPDAKAFYKSWSDANDAKICGMHSDATKCRGADVPPPPPPPSPLPEWCPVEFKKFEQCLFGNPRTAIAQPQECQDTYSKLYACQVAAERVD